MPLSQFPGNQIHEFSCLMNPWLSLRKHLVINCPVVSQSLHKRSIFTFLVFFNIIKFSTVHLLLLSFVLYISWSLLSFLLRGWQVFCQSKMLHYDGGERPDLYSVLKTKTKLKLKYLEWDIKTFLPLLFYMPCWEWNHIVLKLEFIVLRQICAFGFCGGSYLSFGIYQSEICHYLHHLTTCTCDIVSYVLLRDVGVL